MPKQMSTIGPMWTTLCRNMVLVIDKLQLTRRTTHDLPGSAVIVYVAGQILLQGYEVPC